MLPVTQFWQDLDVTEAGTNVRTTATVVHRVMAFNAHATDTCYLQFFEDDIGDVTVGTDPADLVVPVPAGVVVEVELHQRFDELAVAATSTPGGNTAPGDDPIVTVFYN